MNKLRSLFILLGRFSVIALLFIPVLSSAISLRNDLSVLMYLLILPIITVGILLLGNYFQKYWVIFAGAFLPLIFLFFPSSYFDLMNESNDPVVDITTPLILSAMTYFYPATWISQTILDVNSLGFVHYLSMVLWGLYVCFVFLKQHNERSSRVN